MRSQTSVGFVASITSKPAFTTRAILRTFDIPLLPKKLISLAMWLQQFYASPLGVIVQQFLPDSKSLSLKPELLLTKTTLAASQLSLTREQTIALGKISKPDTYTLHGRTGSGKTVIYIELARRSITNGKSVLILSPEIGLTSQLATRFREVFGSRVIVMHSQLSSKARAMAWLNTLYSTTPIIVIGPRSTLFSPINDLGLIVVDESHDTAYKQEQSPYYHAIRVASKLRSIHRAILVLGSATPSVADYYLAVIRQKPIIRLKHLALASPLKQQISIVDLKDRSAFTRAPHLSNQLIQAMNQSLAKKEQVLLFLNRRGTARITLCQDCSWQAQCPNCDLPLTYHGDHHALRCHICRFTQTPFLVCPSCGSQSISLRSFGTKAVVEEVQHIFPEARIWRFDTDSSKSQRLENQYHRIKNGEVDILVGTQMLAKGLDLPHLSTLGVVMADSSLYMPDFTAQERNYQLLTQVLGRVGRGHTESQAIVQTYRPESVVLKASLNDQWEVFYSSELKERRLFKLPPFCHLLKLTCRRQTAADAERTAKALQKKLASLKLKIQIQGPAPAFHEKSSNRYQWQLVIKAANRDDLLTVIAQLPAAGWSYDIDPTDLL